MFSQFRQAVENFAPPPPRRSGSQDIARSGSPGPSSHSPKSNSLSDARAPKSNLEERLRAKLAAAELSRPPTPAPIPVIDHPLSPTSTPLPPSPAISPALTSTVDLDTPLNLASIHPPRAQSPQSSSVPSTEKKTDPPPNVEETDNGADISDALAPPSDKAVDKGGPISKGIDPSTHVKPALPEMDPNDMDVESLQKRLKLVEQRFTDVSSSFKKLQAEKLAADAVLRELSPLQTMQDVGALRDYLQNYGLKTEIAQDEIRRLTGKLQRQDDRIEELRDTHRLESASQSDQIQKIRLQLEEAEALLKASRSVSSHTEEDVANRNAEIDRLQAEVSKVNGLAKEEEEKRVKAISLLKTVRQKLVKAEKDKDDAIKELNTNRDKEKAEREVERVERSKLQRDIESANNEREKAVVGLKAQFDKEVANLKERHEKDAASLKGQFELEVVTMKSAHNKELSGKNSQITALENSVNALSREKITIFDQLQLRQAELESSQFHSSSMQSQNTELQYQLRECQDHVSAMNEELAEARREQDNNVRAPTTSAEDMARLLSAAEAKHESKLAELRNHLTAVEKERNDSESDWSRKLREKIKETDELKRVLQSFAMAQDEKDGVVGTLQGEIDRLREEASSYQRQVSSLRLRADSIKDTEASANQRLLEVKTRITALEQEVEEGKAREAQLRMHNKTLREEMRKVQSSAALLERQRNPGVGYWTSRQAQSSADVRTSISSNSSDVPSRAGSPQPSASPAANDEEVNLEYLRNVIMQFLEHKEMRPNLVKVLSIILHFTPQETRRIIAKV